MCSLMRGCELALFIFPMPVLCKCIDVDCGKSVVEMVIVVICCAECKVGKAAWLCHKVRYNVLLLNQLSAYV